MCGKPERQPRSGTPALRTRVPPGCVAAPLGRTAMSLETRGSNVGDTRGGRDRTHARTRLAPRRCSRSRIAFSRRTSRKGARNKPQRISCQLPRQAPGSTTPGNISTDVATGIWTAGFERLSCRLRDWWSCTFRWFLPELRGRTGRECCTSAHPRCRRLHLRGAARRRRHSSNSPAADRRHRHCSRRLRRRWFRRRGSQSRWRRDRRPVPRARCSRGPDAHRTGCRHRRRRSTRQPWLPAEHTFLHRHPRRRCRSGRACKPSCHHTLLPR